MLIFFDASLPKIEAGGIKLYVDKESYLPLFCSFNLKSSAHLPTGIKYLSFKLVFYYSYPAKAVRLPKEAEKTDIVVDNFNDGMAIVQRDVMF